MGVSLLLSTVLCRCGEWFHDGWSRRVDDVRRKDSFGWQLGFSFETFEWWDKLFVIHELW